MPRPSIEVRRAGADDVDDLLLLWGSGRDEMVRTGRSAPSAEQVRPRLAEALGGASPEAEVLIARWDGRPAGFAVLRVAPAGLFSETCALHLEQLFVAPDLRRHGVARALLNGCAVRADRSGAEQVVCSVLPWARETHRFFARLGFTPVVVRRAVATSTLRRRLSSGSTGTSRSALEDLLSRRRSLRARARALTSLGTGDSRTAEPDPAFELPVGPDGGAEAEVATAVALASPVPPSAAAVVEAPDVLPAPRADV